jgi:ADP-ribose pyrophosphatase
VDAGESAGQAAVRELKEETGYVGVVSESSPVMFNGMVYTHLQIELCY